MIRTILFIGIATTRTFAAAVARVNRVHSHATQARLVTDKFPELRERPISQPCPLTLPNREPLAYSLQVFQRDCAIRALSVSDNSFRDAVILVTLKSLLIASELLQLTLCRACLLLLQVSAAVEVSPPLFFNLRAAINHTVGIRSDVDYAEINAQYVLRRALRQFFYLAHGVQVVVAFTKHKVNFTFAKWQQLALVVAALKRGCFSAANRPQIHVLAFGEANNSIVVSNAAVTFEGALSFLIQLVSVRNFRHGAHDHLRGQVKLRLAFVVRQFVQGELFERRLWLCLPALLTNPITRLICTLKRLAQGLSLRGRRLQFEINYQLHAAIISQLVKYRELKRTVESLFAVAAFSSPCVNAGVSKRGL